MAALIPALHGGNPSNEVLSLVCSRLRIAWCWAAGAVLRIHPCPAGIVMFAVGVGKAVEEELRAIASEPVEQHFSYSADFTTMTHLVENFKLNICPGGCPSQQPASAHRAHQLTAHPSGWCWEGQSEAPT